MEVKYWLYYIKRDDILENVPLKSNSRLYAYTDNKELARDFEKNRNMDLFIKVKRTLDRDDISYLADAEFYGILDWLECDSKNNNNQRSSIKIAATKLEICQTSSIANMIIHQITWQCVWIPPYVFKDKYIKSLHNLGYNELFDFISNGDNYNSCIHDELNNNADLLECFLTTYSDTMRV